MTESTTYLGRKVPGSGPKPTDRNCVPLLETLPLVPLCEQFQSTECVPWDRVAGPEQETAPFGILHTACPSTDSDALELLFGGTPLSVPVMVIGCPPTGAEGLEVTPTEHDKPPGPGVGLGGAETKRPTLAGADC